MVGELQERNQRQGEHHALHLAGIILLNRQRCCLDQNERKVQSHDSKAAKHEPGGGTFDPQAQQVCRHSTRQDELREDDQRIGVQVDIHRQ